MTIGIEHHDQEAQKVFKDEIQDYEDVRNRESLQKAEADGFIVFEPLSDELQLDLDTQTQRDRFYAMTRPLGDHYPALVWLETKSKTEGKFHVRVLLAGGMQLDDAERIALQAIMGSDARRELCNLRRVHFRATKPVVLIETKQTAKEVNAWFKQQGRA